MPGQQEGRPAGAALRRAMSLRSQLADVDRLLLAVVALGDLELDGLALVEGLEALALDLGVVGEHVVAVLLRDEAVALVRVEPLDGTCSHADPSYPALEGQPKATRPGPPSRAGSQAADIRADLARTCEYTRSLQEL